MALNRLRAQALIVLGLALGLPPLSAQEASPQALDVPGWFSASFLDFNEETAAAAKAGKQLMLYFGQDGCPYCRELIQTNFSQMAIVEKTRAHFVAIEVNIWGDREVTWIDGRKFSEKALAKLLKVQFTPTLLFIDASGGIVARLNGYYPPNRFSAALDYVIGGMAGRETLGEYLARAVGEPAHDRLNDEPFLMRPPHDLRRKPGAKPLAVIFETRYCQPCDQMHAEGFRRAEVKAQLRRFDIARFALGDPSGLTTPAGDKRSAQAWARELNITYTPSIVFFDDSAREVFRVEGYTRPFHLATAFEYVAGGGYRQQPEFQRYIRDKADRMRAKGQTVRLWP
jgi:thioredoxin-related protein